MRRESSNTAGITWFDAGARIDALRRAVSRAARTLRLREAVLFGSLATGRATVRSDADLLLVVESSEHANPRDRIPGALEALRPLPCPIDLFVYTTGEVERLRKEGSPLMRAIDTGGMRLF